MLQRGLCSLALLTTVLAVACGGSSQPSAPIVVTGTYQLQTVRGSALPVPLFSECATGGSAPCAACSQSAASGTLTLAGSPNQFTITLVASGECVDPKGRSPTTPHSYTIGANGPWSDDGHGTVSFSSNALALATGTVSGLTVSTAFDWLNPDPGGQPAHVTAVFGK